MLGVDRFANEPHEIIPKLFLSSEKPPSKLEVIKELGITHIVVAGHELTAHFKASISYHVLPISDWPKEDILRHFDKAVSFIHDAIEKQNGTVLVHCAAGVSRSPSVILSYLMKIHKMSLETAFELVKSKRKIISPNRGFRRQLVIYEKFNHEVDMKSAMYFLYILEKLAKDANHSTLFGYSSGFDPKIFLSNEAVKNAYFHLSKQREETYFDHNNTLITQVFACKDCKRPFISELHLIEKKEGIILSEGVHWKESYGRKDSNIVCPNNDCPDQNTPRGVWKNHDKYNELFEFYETQVIPLECKIVKEVIQVDGIPRVHFKVSLS
eukprot:TRINITY_DN10892_c0_g1_i1.p1 TRINITY_DN10892_c0_g1~~TRINITY_DN10892_c0_g1_i1.p1  ORF type:complete len:346 (-),score=86.57 TRINITY_DN10892_c0_g1_i1:118-1092(-)